MRHREASQKAAWSLDESLIAQRMRSEGKTLQQISNAVGRSVQSVNGHLVVVDQRAFVARQKALQKSPPKVRSCMCCQKSFMSAGPHNRLCLVCRRQDVSPYATF